MRTGLEDSRNRLKIASARLEGVSPLKRISGGYAYLEGADGRAVTKLNQIRTGDTFTAYVSDGRISARVTDTERITHG